MIWLSKIVAILRIVRPVNCLMIGFAVVIGEFIALGELPGLREAFLGFATASTMMAGTMAVNDYYDIEIDRINRPERPLPSGILTPQSAIALGLGSCAVGLAAAAQLNIGSLTIAILALCLMLYYNTLGKRTGFFGNIVVSICIGLPFIFGGAAAAKITNVLVFFALMAFTANLGREVTKGIMDVDGDRSRMIRTVAVACGSEKASKLAAAIYLTSVGLSLAPPILGLVGPGYLAPVSVSDAGFVAVSISLIRRWDRKNARRVKNYVLVWMFVGLLAFVAGSIRGF